MPTMASGRSLAWLMEHRAVSRADHPFLIWEPLEGDRRTWTYAQFAADARRVAAGLRSRGVQPGQTLILHLENSPEFLLTWFACSLLGAVPVCTNTKSVGDEIRYFGEHAEVVGAVTSPAFAELVGRALPDLGWMAVTDDERPLGDGGVRPEGSFARLLASEPDGVTAPVAATDPAWIQYTSGTTSRPKAVVLTHANGLWGAKLTSRNEGLTADDVHFVHLPLFHINAICYSVLSSMWVGATVVLVPRFSASRFWEVSRRHGCTWASVIPFCIQALMTVDQPEDHTYRLWGNGICIPGEKIPWGIRNIGWYGMTETIAHPIIDDVDLPCPFGTMGRPAPGYQVELRTDEGRIAEIGEPGRLFVKGQPGLSLFAGYLHDEAATRAAVDPEGWLDTGDRATAHQDGSLSFSDRSKDMLKVGGENVAASEVERVILEVTGVSEVAVVGAPDRFYGEVPVAFVIPGTDDPALLERVNVACTERLASFKVPRRVVVVDELPRSTLNKVAKAELRDRLAKETSDI
ncbi:MAG TPA: AMP-binding protein [Acidimicrobiales bacterium]|jgi:crotonobetaine/carnitine-CoA ligase|nr:AMP-binding protein [Acidimicrobiales bacterium]